jgi:hypothetical protein
MKVRYCFYLFIFFFLNTLVAKAQATMDIKPAFKWFEDCIMRGSTRHFMRKADGTLWSCVPGGRLEQERGIDHVAAIATSTFSILALKDDGTVWIWGETDKKSGNPNSNQLKSDVPVQVTWIKNAVDICIGQNVAYALLQDGSVRVWGSLFNNNYYALPRKFPFSGPVKSIVVDMALLKDGTVWTWGNNSKGQLGNDTSEFSYIPLKVNSLENIIAISSSGNKRYALKADGTVWTWGEYESSTPVKLKNIEHAVAISTYGACFALLQDGTMMSWGDARLGATLNNYAAVPQKIKNFHHVIGIHASVFSGVALLEDSTVMGWGVGMVATGGDYHRTDTPVIIASLGKNSKVKKVEIAVAPNIADIVSNRNNVIEGLSKTQAISLKHEIAGQLAIFYKLPQLEPSKGFITHIGITGEGPDQFNKLLSPKASVAIGMSYLEKDNAGEVKNAEISGASIYIKINAINELTTPFANDFDKLKLPEFFEAVTFHDSTADYLEMGWNLKNDPYAPQNHPLRIIKRNNRPLFIPLSRKEFLQYVIAKKAREIKDQNETIETQQKDLASTKKSINDPSYESVKKILSESVAAKEKNIEEDKEVLKSLENDLSQYQQILNSMSTEEAQSPARIDKDKQMVKFDLLNELVPVERYDGVPLYKINANYFDKSPGAPVTQLISISYSIVYSALVTESEINYLNRSTIDMYNQLDYHALKESME